MATVTHYIYSHYDPPHRKDEDEALVEERAQDEPELDPWLTEPAFGANRHNKFAPRFVPSTVSYDEVNNMIGGASSSAPRTEEPEPSSFSLVSDWYRSLPRSSSAPTIDQQASVPTPTLTNHAHSALIAPALPAGKKTDWFTTDSLIPNHPSFPSTSTLADILSREPPPERSGQPFVPPVFLHLGPSNKGFVMLQQKGWSEGEALGATAPRRSATQKLRERQLAEGETRLPWAVKSEERELEIAIDDDGEILEVKKVEVVDLTLSDSDEGDDLGPVDSSALDFNTISESFASTALDSHNPTALLTPIATVLKSDRLGIGLKAKTVGPYKQSKKRVTHNQAALAAHVRANEEMRKKKALLGRGAKSFARISKADEESRRHLLASLKAD